MALMAALLSVAVWDAAKFLQRIAQTLGVRRAPVRG